MEEFDFDVKKKGLFGRHGYRNPAMKYISNGGEEEYVVLSSNARASSTAITMPQRPPRQSSVEKMDLLAHDDLLPNNASILCDLDRLDQIIDKKRMPSEGCLNFCRRSKCIRLPLCKITLARRRVYVGKSSWMLMTMRMSRRVHILAFMTISLLCCNARHRCQWRRLYLLQEATMLVVERYWSPHLLLKN